jgi:hypothetical protein
MTYIYRSKERKIIINVTNTIVLISKCKIEGENIVKGAI